MKSSTLTVEEAIEIVENVIERGRLNKVQEIVFRQSWEGKSYSEIANSFGYEDGYIRDVGFKLWQLLSQVFGKKVTKNNFHGVLKQQQNVTDLTEQVRTVLEKKWQQTQEPLPKLQTTAETMAEPCQDWGDAIDVSVFHSRTEELAILQQWIVQEHCRLVTIYGMGGIGKTALTAKLAQQVQGEFQYLIWRSLRNAPSPQDLIAELLQFLSQNQPKDLPTTLDGQILQLIESLRSSRCLLILDNAESILQSGDYAGGYQTGYEGYGQLLRCMADTSHASCVILTSREKLRSLAVKEGEKLPVRSLRLTGLETAAGREIVQEAKGEFWASEAEWRELIEHYAGNPLALKMVAAVIQDFFERSVSQFLECLNQGLLVVDDIRHLLDQQFNRLLDLEKELMSCLAARQEPVSFVELLAEYGDRFSRSDILVVLVSLQRRSLIEKVTDRFTVVPLLRKYVINHMIQHI